MKTIKILFAAFLLTTVCTAQTIDKIKSEKIINKYNSDNWSRKLDEAQTVYAKLSRLSEEESLIITYRIKKPDKYKMMVYADSSVSFNSYDGNMHYSFIRGVSGGFLDAQQDVLISNDGPDVDVRDFLEYIKDLLSYADKLFKAGGFTIETPEPEESRRFNDIPFLKLVDYLKEDGEGYSVVVYINRDSYQFMGMKMSQYYEGEFLVLGLDKLDININLDDSVFKIEL